MTVNHILRSKDKIPLTVGPDTSLSQCVTTTTDAICRRSQVLGGNERDADLHQSRCRTSRPSCAHDQQAPALHPYVEQRRAAQCSVISRRRSHRIR